MKKKLTFAPRFERALRATEKRVKKFLRKEVESEE